MTDPETIADAIDGELADHIAGLDLPDAVDAVEAVYGRVSALYDALKEDLARLGGDDTPDETPTADPMGTFTTTRQPVRPMSTDPGTGARVVTPEDVRATEGVE